MNVIEEIVACDGNFDRIIVQLKVINGREYIDVRKWIINSDGNYVPLKDKGLCLGIHKWKVIIFKISKFIEKIEDERIQYAMANRRSKSEPINTLDST